ncbi:MAG TPA: EAL domain-containing protein [Thermoanaerobaculia bacterium]|jgi:diguanylate cyclase (GGDEF)-like protein/PAS domain S-box-containing protein|nr:EAL domain-containing protein [Thermoanaerobaculia bacterium]
MSEPAGAHRGSELLAALQDPEHFRVLVEDVQLVAVFVDPQGRVAHCNPYLLRLTGWERDEVLGEDWFDRFLPAHEREYLRRGFLARVSDGTIPPVAVSHIVTRLGERRLLRWSNTVLRGTRGEMLGSASIGEDVTDRARTEEALSVQSAYYRQLFESSPVGIALIDNVDRVVDANPGFTRLFGWTAEEARGRFIGDLIIPDELTEEASGLTRAVLGGSNVSSETQRRHRDGTLVDVAVLGCPVQLDDRQLGVFALYLDIVERRRAEEALRRSEERYALAARGANDGLWDWDLERDEIYFSARWAAMLGYDEREIANDPQEWFSRVHPGDRSRLQREITEHVEGRSPHFQCEYRLRHRNSSFRWMLSRGLAVRRGDRAYRMAGSQTDISDRKQAESQLLHEALHDALTGLPNRALFTNRLEMALQRARRDPQTRFAVLFLDLDRFKVINDSLGHPIGDELLVALGDRLRAAVRVIDTVARLGGDEFGFLLEGLMDVRHAIRNAERVLEELARPFHLPGHEVFTSGSIGIAVGDGNCQGSEQILRDADIAMYRAKAQGRSGYAVFDQEMHRQAVAAMQLENDLRRALERHELELHYQPVAAVADGRLCGFEALVRWHHPERGLLAPGEFIPAAEETGLIVPLGAWVLEAACRQLAAWEPALPPHSDLAVSVNLSARQLTHPELVTQIRRTLDATGANPRRLKLEITESVLMADAPATHDLLQQLRADLGLGVMIDDFGTGYSSLAYLHQFPIETLKIDRSFVSRLGDGDEEIVRAIVTLGKGLGMWVLGEGVETPAQLSALARLGCDLAQGNLLSPPLPAADAEAVVRQGRFGPW